jgi:hypothetical protein
MLAGRSPGPRRIGECGLLTGAWLAPGQALTDTGRAVTVAVLQSPPARLPEGGPLVPARLGRAGSDDSLHRTQRGPRIRHLDSLGSPYRARSEVGGDRGSGARG